jgi:hypothetical protein
LLPFFSFFDAMTVAPDEVDDDDGDGRAQPEWTKLMGEELMIQVRMNADTKGAYCRFWVLPSQHQKATHWFSVFDSPHVLLVRRCIA